MKDNIPGLKSKEEILAKHNAGGKVADKRYRQLFGHRQNLYAAMEEYAQQFQPPSSTYVQVEELAKRYAATEWKSVDDSSPIVDEVKYEAFKVGFLAASPKGKEEDQLAKIVKEVTEEDGGVWMSCSGCHETVDGQETGHYNYSDIFKCYRGGGCRECGGIGVVYSDGDSLKRFNEPPDESTPLPSTQQGERRFTLEEKEECPHCGGEGYVIYDKCDVEGCNFIPSGQGIYWRETGYWCLCSNHMAKGRAGEDQPQMKQSAIDRENSRDEKGQLPLNNQQ